MFIEIIDVFSNHKGLLLKNNVLTKVLEPGRYYFFRLPLNTVTVINIPSSPLQFVVTNQEVLTKDLISLRFSYSILYHIANAMKFAEKLSIYRNGQSIYPVYDAQEFLHITSQVILRELISGNESREINTLRTKISGQATKKVSELAKDRGIVIESVMIRDILFPKIIQEVFAHDLESKIRATIDLTNARTRVAAARALVNAASLIKDHPQIEYLEWLETIRFVSKSGSHTFILGQDASTTRELSKGNKS